MSGRKDDGKKTNPTLVDWEAVPEDEREKDRVAQLRAIARVLARAVYTVMCSSRESDKQAP